MSAARDLDMLRAVLGEEQLDYLGYSYGAYLGTVYAGTYPDKVGRTRPRRADRPRLGDAQVTLAQAQGIETALRAYLAACIPAATCPFTGTVDDGMARVRSVLDAVARIRSRRMTAARSARHPARLHRRAAVRRRDLAGARLPLHDRPRRAVRDRPGVADGYYGRTPEGEYTSNQSEAFRAVRCLDYPSQNNVPVMKEQREELTASAPYLGPLFRVRRPLLPVVADPRRPLSADRRTGAAPVLVLGTTNDPATPYPWAVAVATQLESGVLVTRR